MMALHIEDTGQNMALAVQPNGTDGAELMVYSNTSELIKKVRLSSQQCQQLARALLTCSNTQYPSKK